MRVLLVAVLVLLGGLQPTHAEAEVDIWIVSGPGAASPALVNGLEDMLGPGNVHVYPNLEMLAVHATERVAAALAQRGLDVVANEVFELHLDRSVPYIGAHRVKEALGSQLAGPTVLVIDTGVDSLHPDFVEGQNLAANVAARRSPNGLVQGFSESAPVTDRAGHGSHVAGIVAGLGNALGDADARSGKYVGVYSNGRVASFQASTGEAAAEEIGVELQAALEGFEWALQNQQRFDIRVITNSWGSQGAADAGDPVAKAALRAYAAGITVFFSAGNEGASGTLNRHCLVPWVVCVAAGGLDGTRSSFSSMGNRPMESLGPYDHPDITAPGAAIRSAEPVTGAAGLLDHEPLYRDRSGTSMAAPHAAGVAALVQAGNPSLSPDQVMDILVATADPMAEEAWQVGGGYINAHKAHALGLQTTGQRHTFLAGEGVKYGGPATGDPAMAADPVSVGYDAASGGTLDAALLREPAPSPWLAASWLGWALLGLAALLVVAGWRRAAPAEQPAGRPARQ